jgi:hypothetical protein
MKQVLASREKVWHYMESLLTSFSAAFTVKALLLHFSKHVRSSRMPLNITVRKKDQPQLADELLNCETHLLRMLGW